MVGPGTSLVFSKSGTENKKQMNLRETKIFVTPYALAWEEVRGSKPYSLLDERDWASQYTRFGYWTLVMLSFLLFILVMVYPETDKPLGTVFFILIVSCYFAVGLIGVFAMLSFAWMKSSKEYLSDLAKLENHMTHSSDETKFGSVKTDLRTRLTGMLNCIHSLQCFHAGAESLAQKFRGLASDLHATLVPFGIVDSDWSYLWPHEVTPTAPIVGEFKFFFKLDDDSNLIKRLRGLVQESS